MNVVGGNCRALFHRHLISTRGSTCARMARFSRSLRNPHGVLLSRHVLHRHGHHTPKGNSALNFVVVDVGKEGRTRKRLSAGRW
jgi:hypothetical protein